MLALARGPGFMPALVVCSEIDRHCSRVGLISYTNYTARVDTADAVLVLVQGRDQGVTAAGIVHQTSATAAHPGRATPGAPHQVAPKLEEV